jgi:CubicO group peptidase (beta-lactamase class C family)
MDQMKHIIIAVSCCLILTACESKKKAVKNIVAKTIDQDEVNGFIHIELNNELLFHSVVSSLDGDLPIPNENSSVHLASLSKIFTEVLILKLVDENKIYLDSSIYFHRKSFKPDFGKIVSVRHLLEMRSGLPRELHADNIEAGLRFDDRGMAGSFLDTIENIELAFYPGSEESYSNLNYWLLGAVVEQVTSKNIEEAARDYIFEPLQMVASGLTSQEIDSIQGYVSYKKDWIKSKLNIKNRYTSGGFYSSIQDLLKLIKALSSENFLSQESKSLLSQNGVINLEVYGSLPSNSNMLIHNEEYGFTMIFLNNIGLKNLSLMTELKSQVEQKLSVAEQGRIRSKKVTISTLNNLRDSIPLEKGLREWIGSIETGNEADIYRSFSKYAVEGAMSATDPTWVELVKKRESLPNFRAVGYRWENNHSPKGIEVWFTCDSVQKIALRWVPSSQDTTKVENLFIMPDDMEWMGEQY